MTFSRSIAAAAILISSAAAQAAPIIFDYSGSSTTIVVGNQPYNVASTTPDSYVSQTRGYNFAGNPALLTSTTSLTPASLYRSSKGLGVCGADDAGATNVCSQIDNINQTDAISIDFSGGDAPSQLYISAIDLSYVDSDDSFILWAIDGGNFTQLTPQGKISTFGTKVVDVAGTDDDVWRINFSKALGLHELYALTVQTNVGSSDAFTLKGVIAEVPEPAMLGLFGLGALGLAAARRRRR